MVSCNTLRMNREENLKFIEKSVNVSFIYLHLHVEWINVLTFYLLLSMHQMTRTHSIIICGSFSTIQTLIRLLRSVDCAC